MSKRSRPRQTGKPPSFERLPDGGFRIRSDKSVDEVTRVFARVVAESPTIEIDGIRCRPAPGPTTSRPQGGQETLLYLRAIDPAQQRRLDRILDGDPEPETCPACRQTVRRIGSTTTGRLVFTCSACGIDMGDPTLEEGW